MKRVLGAIVLLCAAALVLSAQTITVTKPALNETWVKGQSYTITWNKSGSMGNQVRISLRNAATLAEVAMIVDGASNSGSYPWTVPGSTADGSYKIRVKVKNETVQDDSDAFFISASAPPAGTISVTKPSGGKWYKGKTYDILWTKSGTLPNQVTINLMNSAASSVVKVIAASASNSGTFSWTIPSDVAGGDYRVRVKAMNATPFGDSPVFSIGTYMPPGGVPDMGSLANKVLQFPGAFQNMSHFEYQWDPQPPSSFWTARQRPCPNTASESRGMVGFDDFPYPTSAGTTNWCHWTYRSRVFFAIAELQGQQAKLVSAKMKVTQVDSVRRNTNFVSAADYFHAFLGPWNDWTNFQVTPWIGSLNTGSADNEVDITDTVRKWMDGSLANYGLLLNTHYSFIQRKDTACISCYHVTLTVTMKR